MSNQSDESKLLLLNCTGVGNASAAVVAIMKDLIPTVVQQYSEIMEDGVASSWMDESYATRALEVLEEQEEEDPSEVAVETAATKAENLMSTLMTENHAVLQTMSDGWLVDEVTFVRRFPNLWLVKVTGARFPF